LTQRELAERAGISQVTIARLESGRVEAQFGTTKKLASILGATPDELVEEPEPLEQEADVFAEERWITDHMEVPPSLRPGQWTSIGYLKPGRGASRAYDIMRRYAGGDGQCAIMEGSDLERTTFAILAVRERAVREGKEAHFAWLPGLITRRFDDQPDPPNDTPPQWDNARLLDRLLKVPYLILSHVGEGLEDKPELYRYEIDCIVTSRHSWCLPTVYLVTRPLLELCEAMDDECEGGFTGGRVVSRMAESCDGCGLKRPFDRREWIEGDHRFARPNR